MKPRHTMKGAKKRLCAVCRHRVFYVSASPFKLDRVENGRARGSAVLDLPAGALICGVCVAANPGLALKVNPLPVAYKTKSCHRCGGSRRVPAPAHAAPRWKGTKPETVPCPVCQGKGEVAA